MAAILALSTGAAVAAAPQPSTNRLVTASDISPPTGADGTTGPYSISDDGTKIAFEFAHTNDGDASDDLGSSFDDNTGGFPSVFVYDRETQDVKLVNHTPNDQNATDNAGGGRPAVSADGEWVAFTSNGTNLIEDFDDNSNAFSSLFLRNLNTGSINLVNHVPGEPLVESNGSNSGDLAISADGSKIAYRSIATDLVSGFIDNNGADGADVYLWDRETNTNTLVSHAHDSATSGTNAGPAYYLELPLQISDDGRYVAYTSAGTNLVAGFTNNNASDDDIFLFDAATGKNTLVTHGATKTAGSDGKPGAPALAAKGGRIAYESTASDLVGGFDDNNAGSTDVYVWSRSSNTSRLVTFSAELGKKAGAGPSGGFNGSKPLISANGKAIAYESDANDLIQDHADFNTQDDIWIWTEKKKNGRKVYTNALVTHRFDDPTQGHGQSPNHLSSFSKNGKRIVFQSGDTGSILEGFVHNNGSGFDVYVYDTAQKAATLVSRAHTGPLQSSNGDSSVPQIGFGGKRLISFDGQVIPFWSTASDVVLSFTDKNGAPGDLYVFGPPTG